MKRWLAGLHGVLAALALFAIMVLTLVDVLGRKLLSHSVPGSLELTELLMVVVIFAGLPLVALRNEHIVFDSLDAWLPRGLLRAQQAIVEVLCAAALAGTAWLLWEKAGQLMSYGDVTAQLQIPQGWFVYGMALLCVLTAVVHLLMAVQPVAHHHIGVDDPHEAAS